MPTLDQTNFVLALRTFASEKGNSYKGNIAAACNIGRLVVAEGMNWPLDPERLLTGGQIRGMGGGKVRAIFVAHGIPAERLTAEGGRTNRGTVDFLKRYVAFLNALADGRHEDYPLGEVVRVAEEFWAEEMQKRLAEKPFAFALDRAKGLRPAVRQLISLARERSVGGQHIHGTVLQHLVGAKLEIALGGHAADLGLRHNRANTKDTELGREGDFQVADTVFHITTNPSMALIEKCRRNLDAGLRPIVITLSEQLAKVDAFAEEAAIGDRVETLEVEQFIATNLYEAALFQSAEVRPRLGDLVARYNALVVEFEQDPSLTIELM